MVTFSKVLNTLGFARFKRRSRATAASDDLCAPYSTLSALSVQQQTEEFSVLVAEDAEFERAKITTPDGAWERRWPRRAPSRRLQSDEDPTRSAELSRSILLAAQGQVWDAARAAAGAVALTISAVLLDDSIPPDARKHFQLGLQLLEGAIAADDAAPEPDSACADPSSPIPQAQLHFRPRERTESAPPVPFTSGPRDRYSRPTLDRWLLDYGPAGGVHKHLASVGALIFDLALTKEEAQYRASGAPFHVGVEFAQFQRAAVEPRVRTLVVLSRQFPWPVEVHAAAGCDFVRVCDVLRAMRKVAHDTLRETEFQLALHTPDGRRRLARAHGRRMRRLGERETEEIQPLCLVDYLGEHTVLGSLRRDVDNALLKELIPQPWPPGTAETVHLVADFVSHAHVRAVLEARS